MQWFSADPHLGSACNVKQRHVDGHRDYSADDWDDYVIHNYNLRVMPEDTLTVIGDFTHHSAKSYLDRIFCKNIHLVQGNHDRVGSGRYFKTCNADKIIKIGEHECHLYHYPIAYWLHAERGSFHLHGHVHDWYPDYMGKEARALDVSVDTALRYFGHPGPFSADFIIKYMLARPGHASIEGRPKL